jgi:hypothetical protein
MPSYEQRQCRAPQTGEILQFRNVLASKARDRATRPCIAGDSFGLGQSICLAAGSFSGG